MKNISGILKKFFVVLFVFIGFLALVSANWCYEKYGDIGFDAIIFTMFSDLNGVSQGLVFNYLSYTVLPTLLLTFIVSFLLLFHSRSKIVLSIRKLKVSIFPFKSAISVILSIIISILLIFSAANTVDAYDYFSGKLNSSEFIEKEYVFPKNVNIEFPEEKRNLIYIFMESMETTFFSKELNGGLNVNVIPELYSLASENTNFSTDSGVGGINTVSGATWTIGATVAQTAGIPLKLPVAVNSMDSYSTFLPGAYTINDILNENGYTQSFMCGSDANFGGRKQYYEQHGVEKIYDYVSAKRDGIIAKDYYDGWWGMEDAYLYQYAKQELPKIAQKGEPFAFFMLTVDTHHIAGNFCEKCQNEYGEQYENVYSCASKQVSGFIDWIKNQDFYENTTIVIVGDHKSMDEEYFNRNVSADYTRRIYNCFINSVATTEKSKNRIPTQLDIFPTTLAAIGCKIEGEKLGLGVNLFSGKSTLAEEYGLETLNTEFDKKSNMYDEKLLIPFND